MSASKLTEYLKKAFEYKNNGEFKQSIDYFYKALTIDNESTEIMRELAQLYSKLCRYERSISFYEQILQKYPNDNVAKYNLANLFKILKEYSKAESLLIELYNQGYEIEKTAVDLFSVLYYNHKYKKIITSYNKYAKNLKNSSALYYVALAHCALGNKNTADEFFKKSFDNDDRNVLAGVEIAFSLLEKGKSQDAYQLALRLLKYSEDARIFYLLAEIEYFYGNIDNAIKYYTYAIKINPREAQYHFKLALTLSIKGFFQEAEESYCKAINLDSNNLKYYYALAYTYYILSKYDLAIRLIDYILSREPNSKKTIALKVLVLLQNKESQSARKLIEQLEEQNVNDDFIFYACSMYYSNLLLWNNAKSAIIKALKLKPESIEYNYQLAKFNFELGLYSETITICEKILRSEPRYIQAILLLSEIYYENKNYEKSQKLLEDVINLDTNVVEAYYIQGKINYEKKEWQNAIEKFKTALSLAPNNEEYYVKIGDCYFQEKKYKEAYNYYKEAVSIDITNIKYRYNMAKCAEEMNDIDSAISNYTLLKRLAPYNIDYQKDYAKFLNNIGKEKEANKILKSINLKQ